MLIEVSDRIMVNNLIFLRKKYKLSQTALARLVGISVYQLRAWESGAYNPIFSLETLHRLCAVFNITSERLLDEELH